MNDVMPVRPEGVPPEGPVDFLIVDDDEAFRSVLARMLDRRGFTVVTAESGMAAAGMARRLQPRRILLDLSMPGESGLMVLPRLLEAVPSAKIVILTGYASIATAVDAIKLGALNYLTKPVEVGAILKAFEVSPSDMPAPVPSEPMSVDRLEWEHIQRVLAEHQGNISATARALKMHRRTLQRKLAKRPVRA
ncbi:MAG TPA: response regulator transcription factor [Burkholderiaceae bacterium]|nr:response regulator transcription factor [Burkholderiaceae bacterium]